MRRWTTTGHKQDPLDRTDGQYRVAGPRPRVLACAPPNPLPQKEDGMRYTRREWGKVTLAALPAGAMLFRTTLDAAGRVVVAKPDSRWAGVQVGMNVPYNFGEGNNMPGDEILRRTVALGIS